MFEKYTATGSFRQPSASPCICEALLVVYEVEQHVFRAYEILQEMYLPGKLIRT